MQKTTKRVAAIGLIGAASLNMLRMLPIYLDPEVGFDGYPPETLEETVAIAQRTGYYISHLVVFIATPLFLLGFHHLYSILATRTSSRGLTLAYIGFVIGQLLYTIGVVVHGLILPEMAREFEESSASRQAAMDPLFDFAHHLATGLGGLGFAYALLSTGIFGYFLRSQFNRLGIAAMVVGALSLVGYLSGVLAILLFESFEATAGVVTLMFVLYFVTGIAMLRSPDTADDAVASDHALSSTSV